MYRDLVVGYEVLALLVCPPASHSCERYSIFHPVLKTVVSITLHRINGDTHSNEDQVATLLLTLAVYTWVFAQALLLF